MNKQMVEDYGHHREQSRIEHFLLPWSLKFLPACPVKIHTSCHVYKNTDCKNLPLYVHTSTSCTLKKKAECFPLIPVSLSTFLHFRITIKNLRTLKKIQNVLLRVCKIKVILEMYASCYRYSETSNTLAVPACSLLCNIFVTVHVHTSVLKCML